MCKTFLKKYFFGCITSFFWKHMICDCKQKAHGVLLYRRGTDLGQVLSKTLKLLSNSSITLLGLPKPCAGDAELLSFCDTINKKIHEQIRITTNRDAQTPYDISSFNIESCISNIDPLLWKVVVLITRGVKEHQRHATTENINHQRKLQCLYTLCVIFI